MTEWSHIAASVFYLAGAVAGFGAGRAGRGIAVPWLLAIGVFLHAGGFVALHSREPLVPLESFPAALSLIGWLVATSYLCALRIARVRGVGVWVGAFAAIFTAAASAGLLFMEIPAELPRGGAWSHAHVLLSTLGFSLLALTSLAGFAYLTKKRGLKRNEAGRFGLPSLESLDRMEHVTLGLGFALLSLGVVTGFAWGQSSHVSPWTWHSAWLIVAWGIYLVPIVMRIVRHQHGDRPARLVVVGFGFLAFSYIGIRLLGLGA